MYMYVFILLGEIGWCRVRLGSVATWSARFSSFLPQPSSLGFPLSTDSRVMWNRLASGLVPNSIAREKSQQGTKTRR